MRRWFSLVLALVLVVGCAEERVFDNALVEDKDDDGVLLAYDCDDDDPKRTDLCSWGEPCSLDSQCHTELCLDATCACTERWSGDDCNTWLAKPRAVDILWVIDNSSSMCDEQVALADGFQTFREELQAIPGLDLQVAVTTVDMHCDPATQGIGAAQGLFAREPADRFPSSCKRSLVRECYTDDDCLNIDEDVYGKSTNGDWTCDQAPSTVCAVNPNGSLNTECRRLCSSDDECQELFDDERYVCLISGNQQDWGCVLHPQTDGCFQTDPLSGEILLSDSGNPMVREDLEPVLTMEQLDLFPCIANVGINQTKCFKYEQGLASAVTALDPEGPNAVEGNALVRGDAYLVVIFVSDEDDCSLDCGHEGAPPSACESKYCGKQQVPTFEGSSATMTVCTGELHEDYYDTCALLPSLDETVDGEPGVLVPTSTYADQLKALKPDPKLVFAAAITGDVVTPEGASAPSEMLAAVMKSLIPEKEACEVRCIEGEWDPATGTCTEDLGTTSKSINLWGGCVGDISASDAPDGNPSAACLEATCYLEASHDLRLQVVAAVRAVLGLPEGAFFSDTDGDGVVDPTSEEVAALEAQLLATADDGTSPLERVFKTVRRETYVYSKDSPFHCYDTSYVCHSESGKADWGSRYAELTEHFGSNGISANLCDSGGIDGALTKIARSIAEVLAINDSSL